MSRGVPFLAAACLSLSGFGSVALLGACSSTELEAEIEDDDDCSLNEPDGLERQIQATCPNGGNYPPTTKSFGPSIDPYSPSQPQIPGKKCLNSARPGAIAFRDFVLATYPCTTSLGIVRDCKIGGRSVHKEGRGWDWGVTHPSVPAETFLAWLLATDEHGNKHAMARRLGVMEIVWNKKIWTSARHAEGWRAYHGKSPHRDHVHFSLSWDGAYRKTSFWTQQPQVSDDVDGGVDGQGPAVVPQWDTADNLAFASAAASTILPATSAHFDAIDTTGISTMYGVRSSYAKLSSAKKTSYIAANKKPGTNPPMPTATSCVGWAMLHLGQAFDDVGQGALWKQIHTTVVNDGSRGTTLMRELQKIGWTAVYWNPDAAHPLDGSKEHVTTYNQVKAGKDYYGVLPDAMMVNYRPTAGKGTSKDSAGLLKLGSVPIWTGVANGGYHVFLGIKDKVNESHSTLNPTDSKNVEYRPFEEFGTTGSVKYLSGVILMPPAMWPTN